MRKYIHKFKNYTSVEVDNLHDLKEGDLALYEDKFVTRNNGKVEEVVKGSGSSSEEEYSTDYPDDLVIAYTTDTNATFFKPIDNCIYSGTRRIEEFVLPLSNIDKDSIFIEAMGLSPVYQDSSLKSKFEKPLILLNKWIQSVGDLGRETCLVIKARYALKNHNDDIVSTYLCGDLTIKFKMKSNNNLYKLTIPNFDYLGDHMYYEFLWFNDSDQLIQENKSIKVNIEEL